MDALTLFKDGYGFASSEKTFNDMHSKFERLDNDASAFMLGYALYCIETSKSLDGASTESLSSKMNIGIAQECIKSVVNENSLDSNKYMEISNTLYEMAGENSIYEVAKKVLSIIE